jgi:hypothetical protein
MARVRSDRGTTNGDQWPAGRLTSGLRKRIVYRVCRRVVAGSSCGSAEVTRRAQSSRFALSTWRHRRSGRPRTSCCVPTDVQYHPRDYGRSLQLRLRGRRSARDLSGPTSSRRLSRHRPSRLTDDSGHRVLVSGRLSGREVPTRASRPRSMRRPRCLPWPAPRRWTRSSRLQRRPPRRTSPAMSWRAVLAKNPVTWTFTLLQPAQQLVDQAAQNLPAPHQWPLQRPRSTS